MGLIRLIEGIFVRFDAGLLGTACAWQVVGTCAEAAPLVGSGWAPVPGVSSLMTWLTHCRLTDGGARKLLGGEEAVQGYGAPEALAAVPGTLPLTLSFSVLSPAGMAQTAAGGVAPLRALACLPCNGSLLELSHQAAPAQGRDSSCRTETPRPS